MTDIVKLPVSEATERRVLRQWIYLLLTCIAATTGAVRISTATVLVDPARWPESQPVSTPMFSANDRSRWCTVWSLVERGTFQIDEIIKTPGWDTIDKVYIDGHFYSSKPALYPIAVAGGYYCLKRGLGWNLLSETHRCVQTLLLLFNLVPFVLSLLVLSQMLERYGRTDFSRLFVFTTAAFGTFLTPFLITLNNHSPAAFTCLLAIQAALRIVADRSPSPRWYIAAGGWSMLTVCNELPAGLLLAWLGLLLLRQSVKKTVIWYSIGALPVLAAFCVSLNVSTGSWMPVYASFGTSTYNYVVDGIPSYWLNPGGLDRGGDSPAMYLLHCTFGHHGLFSLTPVFALLPAGWILSGLAILRGKSSAEPTDGIKLDTATASETENEIKSRFDWVVNWSAALLTIALLGFYLTRTQSYNYGGNTAGLRWAFWLTPIWLLSLLSLMARFLQRRFWKSFAVCLLAINVFSITVPQLNPWQPPWLQTLMERLKWVDYRATAEPFSGSKATWLGAIPVDSAAAAPAWVEFRSRGGLWEPSTLRVEVTPNDPSVEPGVSRLHLTLRSGKDQQQHGQQVTIDVDTAAFNAGKPMEKGLKDAVQNRDTAADQGPQPLVGVIQIPISRDEQLRWLEGVPCLSQYKPGGVRYLKTPLRLDAFRCRVLAARCELAERGTNRTLIFRRDVWRCDDVPFGVVQFQDTVTDAADNSILYRNRMTIQAASDWKRDATDPVAEAGAGK